jgi:uncharacterized protein YbbK (DUF523 family)
MKKIPIGISSCLLGHNVRYDGGHKRNDFIIDTLGSHFDFQPFCPEVEIGLGIPRTPIYLVKKDNGVRCVDSKNPEKDLTDSLRGYARQQKQAYQNLYGYILKNGSPSCGMEKVKVYENDTLSRKEVGIYAKELMSINPLLPVEEEGRLGNSLLRKNFIRRVYVLYRWKKIVSAGLSVNSLSQFHIQNKSKIGNHEDCLELGLVLATIDQDNIQQTSGQYILQFMTMLKK